MCTTNTLQKGFTLIELMVSLAIGLVVSLAAVTAFSSAQRAGVISEVQSRMNEDAQMALSILAQQARMAGSNPARPDRLTPPASNLRNPLVNPFFVRGCNTTFSNITDAASASALDCTHAADSTGPDSFSLGYEADKLNTIATNATNTGVPTDCLGNGLTATTATITKANGNTATTSVYEAENRFYIGKSADVANPSLYCKGNGNKGPQPLVENVEDLQITYGVFNPAATSKAILGYLNAFDLEKDDLTLAGLSKADRWKAVAAIRICIVMVSAEKVSLGGGSLQYFNCVGKPVPSSDLRLRRAYGLTVALRNNL